MKLGFDISHPMEIFAAKAEAGELGDNLPPGAPIEYIDLTETHPKYILEDCDQWSSFVAESCMPDGNVHMDHYYQSIEALRKIGIACPDPWLG